MRTLGTILGDEISETISKAIKEASLCDDAVSFDFNGVRVVVEKDSAPGLIIRDWERGLLGYLGKSPRVGPYPAAVLTADQMAIDAKIAAENEARRARMAAEYDRKANDKRLVLRGALSMAGPIDVIDQDAWSAFVSGNSDPYGARCVRYAEEWARLMQIRIANGESLADCAEELSQLADDDGITGFMYGAAVAMLIKCWKHGDELSRWHRKEPVAAA